MQRFKEKKDKVKGRAGVQHPVRLSSPRKVETEIWKSLIFTLADTLLPLNFPKSPFQVILNSKSRRDGKKEDKVKCIISTTNEFPYIAMQTTNIKISPCRKFTEGRQTPECIIEAHLEWIMLRLELKKHILCILCV